MCYSQDALFSSVFAAICCCCKSVGMFSCHVFFQLSAVAVSQTCAAVGMFSLQLFLSAVAVCQTCAAVGMLSLQVFRLLSAVAVSQTCAIVGMFSLHVFQQLSAVAVSQTFAAVVMFSPPLSPYSMLRLYHSVSSLCLFWKFVETFSSVTRRFVDDCCSILSFSALLALSAAFLLSHLCRFLLTVSEAHLVLNLSFFLLLFSSLTNRECCRSIIDLVPCNHFLYCLYSN